MEQNKELRHAWDFVEHTGKSIFLTGKAGTGKTTFLKAVKEHSSKRMIVVAPTGVAAINAGGVTMHSFFQLPLTPYVPGMSLKERYDFGKEKRRIIRSLDMVVIDEVSMVRSDLLDAVDMVLRRYRDHSQPFGGVQLLMIGDLQQLSPVVTAGDEVLLQSHYDTPYFFSSKALQQVDYVTIELTKVFRQQDELFIEILNHIRDGRPTSEDIETLNKHYKPAFFPKPEEGYVRLTTHNNLADHYNENELQKLKGRKYVFQAEVLDDFPENLYPADFCLELKFGAQVMFIKNDYSGDHRYYNGKVGRVVEIDDRRIVVRCPDDNTEIEVEPQEWENMKYAINEKTRMIEARVQGVFRQYPVRLAWAITIHKSQGLTFERAIVDAGRSFASGQVYVALSRCKSLDGLVLATPIGAGNVMNDQRVNAYISRQQEAAGQSIARLDELKEEFYRVQLLELFDFNALMGSEQLFHRTLLEYFAGLKNYTLLHKEVVQQLKTKVVDVAYKWQGLIRQSSMEDLHEPAFLERVKRGAEYFLDALEEKLGKALKMEFKVESGNKKALSLLEERYNDVQLNYLSKNKLLRTMMEQPFDVPTYMTARQEALLDAMEVVMPGSEAVRKRKRRRREADSPFESDGEKQEKKTSKKPQKGETYVKTFELYKSGKTPETIASERGLTLGTIYTHLARFIKKGELSADKIIGAEKVKAIRHALSQLPEGSSIKEIKDVCGDDISMNEIFLILRSR